MMRFNSTINSVVIFATLKADNVVILQHVYNPASTSKESKCSINKKVNC